MPNKDNEATRQESPQDTVVPTIANPGRRRFNAASIGVSGVLMTVTSRSALAMGTCTATGPSGVGSVHTSAIPHNSTQLACGLSPGYWKNHTDSWPISTETNFRSTVGSGPNDTFLNVILTTGNSNDSQLYRHVAAEWLSMLSYPAIQTYLTFAQLKQMSAGTFYSGGKLWTSTQTIAYLTQIQS